MEPSHIAVSESLIATPASQLGVGVGPALETVDIEKIKHRGSRHKEVSLRNGDAAADDIPAYRALERLYHSYLTGLILTISSRAGSSSAADLVFHMFRRQQQANFLPALKRLGLEHLPHAVASAQYNYIVNRVGGVKVEYVYENDQKAWIRYPPPRWIWWGTAICGIPSEVSRAMLAGWHGNNGPALKNPRLGFVCTGQTVDGQPGLEGYYKEYDRNLSPNELLIYSPGERCPRFRIEDAPELPEVKLTEGKGKSRYATMQALTSALSFPSLSSA